MDQTDRDQLKSALNEAASWLLDAGARCVPLRSKAQRGTLLASLVVTENDCLTAGDLAAYFAGLTSDRVLASRTAEDIRNLDDALIELNWFMPSHVLRKLSRSLHPRPRVLLRDERIAC